MFKKSIAIFAGTVAVIAFYGVQGARGYIHSNNFPLAVELADLPHCPSCDHLSVHIPLLEIVVLSALIYGMLCAGAFLVRKNR